MANYVLAYSGGGDMPESEEEVAQVMAAWEAWYGQIGEQLVDGGAPFGASQSISAAGDVAGGGTTGLTGYTVISAGSIQDATDIGKGCPVLTNDGTVDVYECIDM